MLISFDSLSSNQIYHCMTQVIVPRPIAWVLTLNADDSLNLAPFSYFNAVCSDPPTVMLSIGHKPDDSPKDTRVNLEQREYGVIHMPSVAHAAAVTASAASLSYGESELKQLGLTTTEFEGFTLPRLTDCAVAMAVTYQQTTLLGRAQQAVIFANVHQLYVADELVEEQTKGVKINADQMQPLARLGGGEYAGLGGIFTRARPK